MSRHENSFEQALLEALLRASAEDARTGAVDDVDGEYWDAVGEVAPPRARMAEEILEFYREHRAAVDKGLVAAGRLLENSETAAQVKALEGSLAVTAEQGFPLPVSVELAQRLGESAQQDLGAAVLRDSNLAGWGLGVSGGASAVVGVLAGVDLVFYTDDDTQVHPRTWVGGSIKTGISVNGGLEMSFWTKRPITGVIAGWLFDTFFGGTYVRVMLIKQRADGESRFSNYGLSIQFPDGFGLPLRQIYEKHPSLFGAYAGRQKAWARTKRFEFDVVDHATNVSSIAVGETATLDVTVKNTSSRSYDLEVGTTLELVMPSFFKNADVEGMEISASNWKFEVVDDGNRKVLQLTLDSAMTWNDGAKIEFSITNAKSSESPKAGRQAQRGSIRLKLQSDAVKIFKTARFNLVWKTSSAVLDWQATVADGQFTLTGAASGEISSYAESNNTIRTLTTATKDGTDETWILGYIYNYNTAANNTPQVTAVWWEQGTLPVGGRTTYEGQSVAQSGQTTTAYYSGLATDGNKIAITVTFKS
ncbi:MAG: hypothetical protein AAGM22_32825 [Acidobacteriota bacterium]